MERDEGHLSSLYLLRRSLGSPSCQEWQSRRAIQDILSSLTDRLHRRAYPAATGDPDLQEGGWVRLDWQESYGAALWVAHQRALDTTEALQNDLKRLSREQRERSPTHPHGRSRSLSITHCRIWSQNCSRGQSRNHARANSQSCSYSNLWNVCLWSLNEPPPLEESDLQWSWSWEEPWRGEGKLLYRTFHLRCGDVAGVAGTAAGHPCLEGRVGGHTRH